MRKDSVTYYLLRQQWTRASRKVQKHQEAARVMTIISESAKSFGKYDISLDILTSAHEEELIARQWQEQANLFADAMSEHLEPSEDAYADAMSELTFHPLTDDCSSTCYDDTEVHIH